MLFGDPQETRFDLRFSVFGVPVRVSPMFWIAAVLISPGEARNLGGGMGPSLLFIWTAVFFVSILLHEFGHSLMHRRYGRRSHIVLHGFGGFAQPDREMPGPWPQIWVSLAGPAANFLIAGVVWATNLQTHWAMRNEYLCFLYMYLFLANIFWGMLNLLPIWPLDGGRVCREVCYLMRARQPDQLGLKISIGTAGLLVVLGVFSMTGQLGTLLRPVLEALPDWFPAHLFLQLIPGRDSVLMLLFYALLGYASWEALRAYRRPRYDYDDWR